MTNKIVELDVREDLKNKLEPFQKIMTAIQNLQDNDTFVLHAPFKPLPLYPIMKGKGFSYDAEKVGEKHWKITFTKNLTKATASTNNEVQHIKEDDSVELETMVLDNRGLEPPQPMMRTLAKLEKLGKTGRNSTLTIINDRRPMFLYEQLDEQGYEHRTEEQTDGSFKIEIFRP